MNVRTIRINESEAASLNVAAAALEALIPVMEEDRETIEAIVGTVKMIARKYEWAGSPLRAAQQGRPLIDVLAEDEGDAAYFARKAAMEAPVERTEPDYV